MTGTLVVVGHGMAGHRLVERVRAQDPGRRWRIVILAEEPRPAYDRTALSSWLPRGDEKNIRLPGPEVLDDPAVELRLATAVTAVDRAARTVTTADGATTGYDALVLATGSRPFVPPVPGRDLPGCFVYRTVADVQAIRSAAVAGRPGVVIGGGLLGLEAADALRLLGMRPHVLETAPHLLPAQIDGGAGQVLARLVGERGVQVRCGVVTRSLLPGPDGRIRAVALEDGTRLDAELLVFAAGIRPRDDLARAAGLEPGPRGGFLADAYCRTADERIWAVGECAAVEGRCYGLAAPGYRMAELVAAQLTGRTTGPFGTADTSARLKLLGVDVAGFGDSHARTPGAMEYVRTDHGAGTYAKLVLAEDGRTLLGGVLAGDAHAYPTLRSLVGRKLPSAPDRLLRPPVRR
ncbi:FAD-dependent oxidoreductase [Streptomyces sp. ET3-23]|uniref:NAD(P)/FAD-dependent oxidoreductase n=1 Tax=Streptomyces sp. ET3-23 TaxID=2885643 RepID=UPI001D10607E|nr:FAD-dependent oxidoreductase [Streptomyces sp. ET3-23]MCC2277972.1 FAD-dependent oxidoreductase [Streptomyces sp. ET3-23]